MRSATQQLWQQQDRHPGDRRRLFRAVAELTGDGAVLYPGSFVDLAASFVWSSVTYVDVDDRAARFFADRAGVGELIAEHGIDPADRAVRFVHADYADELDVEDASFDVLVSLYAGFVSEHCTRYLRPGGTLLVNPSHGDAAMASIDERYRLRAVVVSRSGDYSVRTSELDTYLVPKRDVEVTRAHLHETGRGIAYTQSPFAYLFERTA
ncbi:MAG: class I SAM-dependent methyltransferase [Actinomycetota bacterium]